MAESFGVAASALAVAELSAKIIKVCAQYTSNVAKAREDIERLKKELNGLGNVAKSVEQLLKRSPQLKVSTLERLQPNLDDSRTRLEELQAKLDPGKRRTAMSKFGIRALLWPFKSQDMEKAFADLSRLTQTISYAMQVDQTAILLNMDQKIVLAKLPVADGAAYDSHADEHNPLCVPDTRTEVLHNIIEWARDPLSKTIYWLNGMAGTGKSTISRTLANKFYEIGVLGATFFFKRNEGDRGKTSKLFSTIARQLVQHVPETARHIQAALDTDPDIVLKALREQFDKLIIGPLSQISVDTTINRTCVIIIDALDECEREGDVDIILKLFSGAKMLQNLKLKFFLTSRPELPIRQGFVAINSVYEEQALHRIAEIVIEHDIATYLKHKLSTIRDDYNQSTPEDQHLPSEWPSTADLQTLIKMTVPLFLFAATVCRFISDARLGSPDEQLREVLQYQTKSQESQLDATYLPILNQMVARLNQRDQNRVLDRFRIVVGSIITLANPLPISALARLLDIPTTTVDRALQTLYSVLKVPVSPKGSVQLLHLSFADFLVDPGRRHDRFWIDEKKVHRQLASHCMRILNTSLRNDICEVQTPGMLASSMSSLQISAKLPLEVQYACRFWTYHLQRSETDDLDITELWRFISSHFLQWLEVLSWIGRLPESLKMLRVVQSLIPPGRCRNIANFVDDSVRFILATRSSVQSAPLQIYSSALAFSPSQSIIRTTYEQDIPDWVVIKPNVSSNWGQILQTLEGHTEAIDSVAYSPDGTMVASASHDKSVILWAADTGNRLQTLEGHKERVTVVQFSPNGRIVASASHDYTVILWSADTGDRLHTLKDDTEPFCAIAFSPDGRVLASASHGKTVILWAVDTGNRLRTLEEHTSWVRAIAFSPDGNTIATATEKTVTFWASDTGIILHKLEEHEGTIWSSVFSPDGKVVASSSNKIVLLWAADTGKRLQTCEGHVNTVTSVAFSPNGRILASASYDKTVIIWAADTGERLKTFEGHISVVTSLAFSPDGGILASVSYDKTVILWTVDTNDHLRTPKGHTSWISSITCSPNGSILASASRDNTVIIWAANTGDRSKTLKGHTSAVSSVVFSPNGKTIASGSHDKTVRLWSANTGKSLYVLKGHKSWVNSVLFSPNNKIVASASHDTTVILWAADTGNPLRTLERHVPVNYSVAFAPDGNVVSSLPETGLPAHWVAEPGDRLQLTTREDGMDDASPLHIFYRGYRLSAHEGWKVSTLVFSLENRQVAFSPDGRVLASAPHDKTVFLWATDTGERLHILEGHTSWVGSVIFSPDGKMVASASHDSTVILWAVDTGTRLQTLEGHTDSVASVVFSSDSKMVASASHDKTVMLWIANSGVCQQIINVGTTSYTLEFDLGNTRILTDVGAFAVNIVSDTSLLKRSQAHLSTNSAVSSNADSISYGISQDRYWITLNGTPVFWLPSECRSSRSLILGSTIAIACTSGNVFIIQLGRS